MKASISGKIRDYITLSNRVNGKTVMRVLVGEPKSAMRVAIGLPTKSDVKRARSLLVPGIEVTVEGDFVDGTIWAETLKVTPRQPDLFSSAA